MEFLLTKIKENLNEQMLLLTISNPRKAEEVKKYNIRPILVKDKLVFQSAAYTKTQVFHKNLSKRELLEEVQKILPLYKQVQLQTSGAELTALINKKGKAAIKVKKQNNPAVAKLSSDKSHLLHNRTKKYILPEGVAVPFLKDLGVKSMRLLTNNPTKIYGLSGLGLEIKKRVPIEIPTQQYDRRYMETKKIRMGHVFQNILN